MDIPRKKAERGGKTEQLQLRPRSRRKVGGPESAFRARTTAANEGLERIDVSSTSDGMTDTETDPSSGGEERVEGLQLGGVSRKILDAEDRNQPAKMKKKKKKKRKSTRSASRKTFELIPSHKPIVKKARALPDVRQWITADELRDPLVDEYVIFVMRDFVIYVIFMCITCFIIFGPVGLKHNYFSNVLSDAIVKSSFEPTLGQKMLFSDIRRPRDFWDFTHQVLVRVLYEPKPKGYVTEKSTEHRVMTENVLFGAPRIRQVRVKNQTCSPVSLFEGVFNECADYYREDVEDMEPFGLKSVGWTYDPPPPDSTQFEGKLSTYSSGGYSLNLARERTFSVQWLELLEKNDWIRFGTRAVFFEFILFNSNTGMFCFAKLIFEIPPLGGIVPSYQFVSLKLPRYVNAFDYFIAACEIVFVCYIAYFTFDEIQQVIHMKQRYLKNWWNLLDIAIVLAAYAFIYQIISCTWYSYNWVHRHVGSIHESIHVSGDLIVNKFYNFNLVAAILAFVVWIKLLKFSTLNRTVMMILGTLAQVRGELIMVTLMLFSVVTGFAVFARVNFGATMREFHTFENALAQMFGMLCGALTFYTPMRSHNMTFAVFTVVYILAIMVIFLNAYVALMVYGYELQLTTIDDLRMLARTNDVIRELFCSFLKAVRKVRFAESIQDAQIIKQDMRIYTNLFSILRRNNYSDKEISLILKKHGLWYGGDISVKTMCDVYEEMTIRNQLFLEVESHIEIQKEVEKLFKTLDVVEMTLSSLINKVDLLTSKHL